MIFLNFMLANYKPILAALIAASIWFHGWDTGASGVRAEWQADINEQKQAMQEMKDRWQEEAAKQSKDYQEALLASQRTLKQTQRELSDAISKNPALRGCVADAEFMRLYGKASSAGLSSNSR